MMSDCKTGIGSYWEATVESIPIDPVLEAEIVVEVAVIGAGYTGLSAALKLAESGHSVAVLEAQHVGWGASGRNGGFCCFGGTKKSGKELVQTYGLEEAKAFIDYQLEAISTVENRLKDWNADVDRHSKGEVILAHRPKDFEGFAEEAAWEEATFGLRSRVLDQADLKAEGLSGPEFFGGHHVLDGFALNPMKYVLALAGKVREVGASIYAHTPVTSIECAGAVWHLRTPGGGVRASKVILAGNGYRDEKLSSWLYGRTLPVMSSVQVTRPLSDDELSEQGWTSDLMAADSRILLHYFRLMPDRRFLFGTRGGLVETPASLTKMAQTGRSDFERMFPAWANVETDFAWHGHVCLSWNLTPFVGQVPGLEDVYLAMAWHGSGIAMASLSGERVAELAVGKIEPSTLPAVMREPFRKFPLPSLRLLYLQLAYWWYGMLDRA